MNRRFPTLPIDAALPDIVEKVGEHRGLILIAEPGAGKTTRVPPALLDSAVAEGGAVWLAQPRRIAAQAAASRIAEERGQSIGQEVGYEVRFERRVSKQTRLLAMTTGLLLRRLQRDPFLDGVKVVCLDEFHERSLEMDLALAMLREVQHSGRDDLAIVVMSATLDPAPLERYLRVPTLRQPGRTFPLEIEYLDRPRERPIGIEMGHAIGRRFGSSEGHILGFLPGVGDIRSAAEQLGDFARHHDADVFPLHGALPLEQQRRALTNTTRRKIVLATNVAETSLTIEGVDQVIDGGLARQLLHDPRRGLDRLELRQISRHSADQRAGRAGRVGPGRVLRLWTRAEQRALPESDDAEIRRVDLARAVLEVKTWGTREAAEFGWFEAPDRVALEAAERLLRLLGAVHSKTGAITAIGQQMNRLGVHPRLARILIEGARRGVADDAAQCVALLDERDLLGGDRGKERRGPAGAVGPSDLLVRLELLASSSRQLPSAVDRRSLRAVQRATQQLTRRVTSELEIASPPPRDQADAALLRSVLHGYPDRVARRRNRDSRRARMVGGHGVELAIESVVQDEPLFVVLATHPGRQRGADSRVVIASAVERTWLEKDFPERVEQRTETTFDPQSGRARATTAISFDDLPLEEPRQVPVDRALAERAVQDYVRDHAGELCRRDEHVSAWLRRCAFVRRHTGCDQLPAFDDADLGERVASVAVGFTRLDPVIRELGNLLRSTLPYPLQQRIDQDAPDRLEVPSGNRIRLNYEGEGPPVLAVRLQEMFGATQTPTVAGGRVPVVLHLLGPNFRPVQITQDLASFWNTTYSQVRKDLRARYPKHAWPEDPLAAQPVRGARRRR